MKINFIDYQNDTIVFEFQDGITETRHCLYESSIYLFYNLTGICWKLHIDVNALSKITQTFPGFQLVPSNIFYWPKEKKDIVHLLQYLVDKYGTAECKQRCKFIQPNKITFKKNNNAYRFQKAKGTIQRGSIQKGCCIYGKSSKASISVGSLSYRTIFGN